MNIEYSTKYIKTIKTDLIFCLVDENILKTIENLKSHISVANKIKLEAIEDKAKKLREQISAQKQKTNIKHKKRLPRFCILINLAYLLLFAFCIMFFFKSVEVQKNVFDETTKHIKKCFILKYEIERILTKILSVLLGEVFIELKNETDQFDIAKLIAQLNQMEFKIMRDDQDSISQKIISQFDYAVFNYDLCKLTDYKEFSKILKVCQTFNKTITDVGKKKMVNFRAITDKIFETDANQVSGIQIDYKNPDISLKKHLFTPENSLSSLKNKIWNFYSIYKLKKLTRFWENWDYIMDFFIDVMRMKEESDFSFWFVQNANVRSLDK